MRGWLNTLWQVETKDLIDAIDALLPFSRREVSAFFHHKLADLCILKAALNVRGKKDMVAKIKAWEDEERKKKYRERKAKAGQRAGLLSGSA